MAIRAPLEDSVKRLIRYTLVLYGLMALIVGALLVFYFTGRSNDRHARAVSRTETCAALFDLYSSQRDQIAENDVRLQSGAFDKLIPQFSTPAVKKASHENAVRNFNRFDNSNLPNFCPERKFPEFLRGGFKR